MAGNAISVKLYQQKALTDTATYGAPITGQQLSISDGSSTVQLAETANGIYTYSNTAFLTAGKTYTLNIYLPGQRGYCKNNYAGQTCKLCYAVYNGKCYGYFIRAKRGR